MLGQYKDTARGHLEDLQYEDFNYQDNLKYKDNLICEDNIEYDNDLKNHGTRAEGCGALLQNKAYVDLRM